MKKDRESVKRGLSVFFWAVALFFMGLCVTGCFGERVSDKQHPDNPALAPGVSFSNSSGLSTRLMDRRAIVDRTGSILCISRRDPERGAVRVHPYKGLLDGLLGYVDRYGRGLEGLEYVYDGYLLSHGKEGARREPLILSVDKNLQALCKKNLAWQMRRLRSRSGAMILMDVRTGQILAMTSITAGSRKRIGCCDRKNLAIKGTVNPWSVMVALAEARALDARLSEQEGPEKSGEGHTDNNGVSSLREKRTDESVVRLKGWHWHRFGRDAGFWTRLDNKELEGLVLGCGLFHSLIAAGFGQETGIDLPGEMQGRLPSVLSANVTDVIASTASATPVQMIAAYTALIKNGSPPTPRLAVNARNQSQSGGASSAKLLHEEAHRLFLTIAGDDRGPSMAAYAPGHCNGSRCYQVVGLGFWPADNPEISYISVLFDARYTPAERRGTLGRMASLARMGAAALTERYRFAIRAKDLYGRSYVNTRTNKGFSGFMPDLRGLSIRSALELAGRLGMRIRISGKGKVTEQYPKPGRRLSLKKECVLICRKGPV